MGGVGECVGWVGEDVVKGGRALENTKVKSRCSRSTSNGWRGRGRPVVRTLLTDWLGKCVT